MTNDSPKGPEANECRQILLETLEKLSAGELLSHENLAILPLYVENGHALPYLLLADAIEAGVLEVTEVDRSGRVPRLKVVNRSDKPVLILAGDELIGAKQNRIVNVTMIVPAEAELEMPVSCVEEGRWSYRGQSFRTGNVAPPLLRGEVTRCVRRSVREGRGFEADQARVWDEVADLHADLGTTSITGAMSDAFEDTREKLAEFPERFPCPEKANGLAVFINGRLVSLELFEHPDLLEKVWASHVESCAVDALRMRCEPAAEPAPSEMVAACTRRIAEAVEEPRKSVGEGYDVGLETEDLVGAALVHGGRVVHLQAFIDTTSNQRGEAPGT